MIIASLITATFDSHFVGSKRQFNSNKGQHRKGMLVGSLERQHHHVPHFGIVIFVFISILTHRYLLLITNLFLSYSARYFCSLFPRCRYFACFRYCWRLPSLLLDLLSLPSLTFASLVVVTTIEVVAITPLIVVTVCDCSHD